MARALYVIVRPTAVPFFSSLQGPNLTFFAAPQPRAETRPVNLRALIRLLEGVFSWGKGGCSHHPLDDHALEAARPPLDPAGRILRVKYNEILTIKCNANAGFSGLSAIFTPSRENSYDKVQGDTVGQRPAEPGWPDALVA